MNYNDIFSNQYGRLNQAQKDAVDQIDGAVMVLAGPGTGKTQLLAMRVANILKNSDAEAGSILCLTFTESAAANMTERMASVFGPQAYRVSVNTFHGLGSEIINKYSQYFYNGAIFRPADELTTNEIIEEILSTLPHSNPLSSKMNGQFTYLGDVSSSISDIKRAGLLPEEIKSIIDQNLDFCSKITDNLRETFSDRISKSTIPKASLLLDKARAINSEYKQLEFTNEPPLSQIFCDNLQDAIDEAETTNKTAPLTKWKKTYVGVNDDHEIVPRDLVLSQKLLALTEVYSEYSLQMTLRGLYDYDDMILRVIHALETYPSLKADLQEKYQYVLVDEFQDTNDGQMRLLNNLINYDPNPNIMVVGDDDQAIFRFQGADISNIQSFKNRFKDAKTIVLTENYRSGKEVLKTASGVSEQIEERLNKILKLEKSLNHNVMESSEINCFVAGTKEHENSELAKRVKSEIDSGNKPSDIAIIARRHSDLEGLLPFFGKLMIPVSYERESDVLSSKPVAILELLSRVVLAIADREDQLANSILPELLSHEVWGLKPKDLWQISLEANRNRKYWLEIMLEYSDETKNLAEWMIIMATESRTQTLEIMIDKLFGIFDEPGVETFRSPLYEKFFSESKLTDNPSLYLEFLSNLSRLRQMLRDYKPDNTAPKLLKDFIALIDRYKELGKTLTAVTNYKNGDKVNFLTAHKAKGLEFKSVYVMNASSQKWGEKSRSRNNLLKFPKNMPFQISGDNSDEKLRLLFVAMTRAKYKLTISSHRSSESGKTLLPLEYIVDIDELTPQNLDDPTTLELQDQIRTSWYYESTNTADDKTRQGLLDLLSDRLSRYKLSVTDLNNFIDVTNDGPTTFLMRSLLKFPSAKSAAAAFGTAMHLVLQRAHTHMSAQGNNKPLEDILGDFEVALNEASLSERDHAFYLQKGIDALKVFYADRIESFNPNQLVEYDFHSANVTIGKAKLTGKIDLIDIDKNSKTIVVTDYKTGKAPRDWQGHSNYEKIKLHKYRQQLLLYKFLVENSSKFKGYSVEKGVLEFVEPMAGKITRLEMNYDQEELDAFSKLAESVWQHIVTLNIPDISEYSSDLPGIIDFEKSLL